MIDGFSSPAAPRGLDNSSRPGGATDAFRYSTGEQGDGNAADS